MQRGVERSELKKEAAEPHEAGNGAGGHPFLEEGFAPRWSALRPENVEVDITLALERAQARIDAVAALPLDQANFASVLLALEEATDELGRAWGYVNHLDSVCNSPTLREAYNKMLPKVSAFYTRVPLNGELWQRVKTFAETPEAAALEGARKRLLDETVKDFLESGADLNAEGKDKLEAINGELATITQKFSENVLDATNAWELVVTDSSRLAGLPGSAIRAARENAREKGYGTDEEPAWRFTLHMPSLLPVMQYAEDESLRRELWEASSEVGAQGGHDNTDLVWRILRLRQEKAQLLGKPDFTERVLERRMVGSGTAALDFVEKLHARVKKPFDEEMQALQDFKASQTGGESTPLEPWELMYWMEKRRKALYDFDEEELRPYFGVNRVIAGLFVLTQRIFGLRFEERPVVFIDPETGVEDRPARQGADGPEVEVWHRDVQFYDVYDDAGLLRGSFYADWYPRESKRGGAWMNPLRTGGPGERHVGLVAGNMNAPIGDEPALLTHDEVLTLFHEFGHLLHHVLGEVEIKSLNGTNVAWDFVEVPSQILENWCWEKEALDLFARHWKTGEALPDALLEKVLRARNYGEAYRTMRQLSFGKLDLALHKEWAPRLTSGGHDSSPDLDTVCQEVLEGYQPPLARRTRPIVRRFSHLFSSPTGYAAGYYSYKWAEVLEADCFTRFQREGILNASVGRAFREIILAQGNSVPPEQLFVRFMGRKPDESALLRRSGLLK